MYIYDQCGKQALLIASKLPIRIKRNILFQKYRERKEAAIHADREQKRAARSIRTAPTDDEVNKFITSIYDLMSGSAG